MRARLAVLLVCLLLSAGCGTANTPASTTTSGTADANANSGLDVGQKAPVFSTQLVSGKTIALDSLRGKVVLLNFWATWCGPCAAEMPYFQTLANKYDSKDFQILAVDYLEKPETITKFTDKLGLKFDVALD